MVSAPAGKMEVVQSAMPEAGSTATAPQPVITLPLLVKAIVPENAVPFWAADDTVAVKTTGVLKVAVVGFAVSVVVVAVAPTLWTTVLLLELKFGSPL